ncbi:hypothetical protein [Neorhizobium sp. DT-125]|uniref:hypothetical protein n=1 Tax=Neorhizobium sp. DT-125 TaxID=3396163 RepID=UPI003F1D59F5
MSAFEQKEQIHAPHDFIVTPELALAELNRVLESREFKGTPRRRKFLQYIVHEFLAGRDRGLKGYTIATIVFGRDESFDPQTDPVVRLEARRLRHDLASYYVSAGRGNPLRISIPKGQYVPVIEWVGVDYQHAASLPAGAARFNRFYSPAIVRKAVAIAFAVFALVAMTAWFHPSAVGQNAKADASGGSLAVLPFKAPSIKCEIPSG